MKKEHSALKLSTTILRKQTALIIIIALMLVIFAGCGSSGLSIDVINSLGYDLSELYISATSAAEWGESVTGGTAFPSGANAKVGIDDETGTQLDFYAVDTDGDYYYFYNVEISKNATVELLSSDDGVLAVVTPKRGDVATFAGEFEYGETLVNAPTPDDALDASVAMPGYESLMIYHPSTMEVILSNERFLQIDAINDPDNHNVIMLDLIQLGGTYEQKLNSADTAQGALIEITQKIIDTQFPNELISSIGTHFVDGGSYYSAINYVWLSGAVFAEAADVPVRGVVETRYYGPTGYVLCMITMADEGVIQNYFSIASNMFNAISFGGGWKTPSASSGTPYEWSDPGDYYYDYDPWSDPGDYGYYDDYYDYYYDDYYDYYYDDYDPWSDPGDYGDYYDQDYYYDDNYYYDDGDWYESNDYDF
ncbi:MAG: hypothetical protein VB064_09910 [Oscillospiraceae bacterium]|nr:hypothetical protein [Oscillospiraceae bacterium]